MGGMVPTVAMSALQTGMDMAQRSAAQDQAKGEAQANAQQLAINQQIADRDRQDQLRRALATQRARFGAQGLMAGSGSADAVLSGIQSEADQNQADANQLYQLRLDRIDDQLGWQSSRSLLDASEPAYRSAFSLMQRGVRSVSLLDN